MVVCYTVEWTEQAVGDLKEIFEYVRIDNQAAAKRIYLQIKDKCQKLRDNPARHRICDEFFDVGINHYRQISIPPYRVIFKLIEKRVFVIAVVDSRRDLESLLFKRLLRMPGQK